MTSNLNSEEEDLLIDLILAHKSKYVRDFLEFRELHHSGVKKKLRKRLKEYLGQEITVKDLTELLDKVERFGDQHAFFFKVEPDQMHKLRNPKYLENCCAESGLRELYNDYKPLILPKIPEIASIKFNGEKLEILWVVLGKKFYFKKMDEIEENGHSFLIKKYFIRKFRATTLFRISLLTGDAELFIHRLPPNTSYEKEKDEYLEKFRGIFDCEILRHKDLYDIISEIEESGEVRTRNIGLRTGIGSYVDIVSSGVKVGISDDPDAKDARKSIKTGVGNIGNFYWLPEKSKGKLEKEIHTIFYWDKVAFARECTEEEVNYVTDRIHHFLKLKEEERVWIGYEFYAEDVRKSEEYTALKEYLEERKPQETIAIADVAQQTNISEKRLPVMLKEIESRGIIQKLYRLKCSNTNGFVDERSKPYSLPEVRYCDLCNDYHEFTEGYVEEGYRLMIPGMAQKSGMERRSRGVLTTSRESAQDDMKRIMGDDKNIPVIIVPMSEDAVFRLFSEYDSELIGKIQRLRQVDVERLKKKFANRMDNEIELNRENQEENRQFREKLNRSLAVAKDGFSILLAALSIFYLLKSGNTSDAFEATFNLIRSLL